MILLGKGGYPMAISPLSGIGTAPVSDLSSNPLTDVEDVKDAARHPGRKSSPEECETCKNRKYQDGSDEMVSFKSAAHISPEASAAVVRAHEQEHVTNAYSKAAQKNAQVISANVSIKTAICPECGRSYVAGGLTTTQIKYKNEENPYQKARKMREQTALRGMHLKADT